MMGMTRRESLAIACAARGLAPALVISAVIASSLLSPRSIPASDEASNRRRSTLVAAAALCAEGAPQGAMRILDGLPSDMKRDPGVSILRQRAAFLLEAPAHVRPPRVGGVIAHAFSPDGSRLATLDSSGRLSISSLEDGSSRVLVRFVSTNKDPPVLMYRKRAIYACYPSGHIDRFDVSTGHVTSHDVIAMGMADVVPIEQSEDLVLADPTGGIARVNGLTLRVDARSRLADPVTGQSLSTGGGNLLVLSNHHVVDIYTLEDLRLRASFESTGEDIRSARFLGTNAVVACGVRGTLTKWRLGPGETEVREAGEKPVAAVAQLAVDGNMIAVAQGQTVRLYEGRNLQQIGTLPVGSGIRRVRFLSRSYLGVVAGDGHLLTYSTSGLCPHREGPGIGLFAADYKVWPIAKWRVGDSLGRPYLSGNAVAAWDSRRAEALLYPVRGSTNRVLRKEAGEGQWLSTTAEPDRILAAWQDPAVMIIDCRAAGRDVRLDVGERYLSVSTDHRGEQLALGCTSGVARTWNLHTSEEGQVMRGLRKGQVTVCCTEDGTVAGDLAGDIYRQAGVHGSRLIAHLSAAITALDYSRRTGHLYVGSERGELRCIELRRGTEVWRDQSSRGYIYEVSCSGDGRLLAVARAGSAASVRLAGTGAIVERLSSGVGAVRCEWEPDRDRVAFVTVDGALLSYESGATTMATGPLCGRGLSWHPRGQVLVTPGRENDILVWDAGAGVLLYHLRGHRRRVAGCLFTRSGHDVLSISADGTLRAWPVGPK
jgi:WD40 repeat protein